MTQTKDMIKDTFWEILEEKPYNKITVGAIVSRCHVNRNTFYYHFQDIPGLMIDSIEEWVEGVIKQYVISDSPVECLTYMAQELMKRKRAFLHLFHSVQKENFLSNLNKLGYDIIQIYVDRIEEYRQISKEGKEKLIKCYKCLFVGTLLDWLEEDASYDLVEFYEELCEILIGLGETKK